MANTLHVHFDLNKDFGPGFWIINIRIMNISIIKPSGGLESGNIGDKLWVLIEYHFDR